MTAYVLDASASVELLTGSARGNRLERHLPLDATCLVPEHFFVEVAGALRRSQLRGLLSSVRCIQAFADLCASPVTPIAVRPLLPRAWSLRGHLTIADALYVALAEELGAPLVTADIRLASSPGLSVQVIRP